MSRRILHAGLVLAVGVGSLVASGAWAGVPTLKVLGSPAMVGGPAEMSIQLAGDDGAAVTADVDVRFPVAELAFDGPVNMRCRVDARLAATHQVAGRLLQAGQLSVAILARGLDIRPLGDGVLARCAFEVRADARQPIAPLQLDFAALNDARGMDLPLISVTGAIVITDLPGLCAGDCNVDAAVTIDEIIRSVAIALGQATVASCRQVDRDGDAAVSISEIIAAVNSALFGC